MINTQGASRLDRSLALPVRNSDTFTAGCQPHTQTNNLYAHAASRLPRFRADGATAVQP